MSLVSLVHREQHFGGGEGVTMGLRHFECVDGDVSEGMAHARVGFVEPPSADGVAYEPKFGAGSSP